MSGDDDAEREFKLLLTAAEAFPQLEHEFLTARKDIVAGFRIFDPWTKLISDKAKKTGTHWFDLLVATLNRGVKVGFVLTDFDPVVRMDMHIYAWQCLRGIIAAGQASAHPENLSARVAMHPSRVGWLPRSLLWPRSYKEIGDQLDRIRKNEGLQGDDLLHVGPGVRPLVKNDGDKLKPRKFPPPPLVPVTHHQKLAVFDRSRLYIGGLDLNDRRFDDPDHHQSSDQTWHDVQVLVSGKVARDAYQHLSQMEDGFNGRKMRPTDHLLRTMSAKRRFNLPYMSPRPIVSEIYQAHVDAIGQTTELLYFESQFFRDERLAEVIAARAEAHPQLTMILMLPAAPEEIAFSDDYGPDVKFGEHLQAKCIDTITDAFGDRLFVGSPVQPRHEHTEGRDTHFDGPIIYLHAKVSLFDEHTGIVSSANLNGRSMRWDTEAGIRTENAKEVAQIKQRCFAHWLGDGADASFYDCKTAVDSWAARAAANARARPADRKGFVLPYLAEEGRADAQALPGVPAEMA